MLRLLVLALILTGGNGSAQSTRVSISTEPERCEGGAAELQIGDQQSGASLEINWSTGERQSLKLKNLSPGDYWVNVRITTSHDTVISVSDTTLYFSITTEICPVGVPLHFSPNGDTYNDDLRLSNIDHHPRFELQIFNRWGQLVHRQKNNYTPWNGEWAGVKLPDGTYYYVLFYDASDKKTLQKGDITILR